MADPRLQRHHILYKPEYTVGIRGDAHRVITTIQRTKGTENQVNWLKNFMLALSFEINRMQAEIQTGLDLRQEKFKRGRKKK